MKKLLLISLFFLTSTPSFAQDLEAQFLESLPTELKEGLEGQESDPRNVESPNTRIKNLESALRDAEDTLARIQYELDIDPKNDEIELKRIGEEFFSSFQSTFMPINEPAGNTEYILDAGDMLTIQIVGQNADVFDKRIERDGTIAVDDVGKVNVAGLSLGEASELIKMRYNEVYLGTNVYIQLTELRDMNVLIVGNVNNPGMYTLSGGSTPLSLIESGGGITESGSYRMIDHKRDGELIQQIDLYKIFLFGDYSFEHPLRSGDVLVVNAIKNEVRISGKIANPGIYEFLEDENLEDFKNYIGFNNIQNGKILKTTLSGDSANTYSYALEDIGLINLEYGDSIEFLGRQAVFSTAKKIHIEGQVNIPGEYVLPEKATLKDAIKFAGGYKDSAYALGGILIRKNSKSLNEDFDKKLRQNMVDFLTSSFTTRTSSPIGEGTLKLLLTERFINEPKGRVIAEFNLDTISSNPSLDTLLEDGDRIIIPKFHNIVHVFGQVTNPSSFAIKDKFKFNDYLEMAGAFGEARTEDIAYLYSPDGSVTIHEIADKNGLFAGFGTNNVEIYPGSVIYVPAKLDTLNSLEFASRIAPIFSSLAISLASLNSIQN